ncbi:hypothetical protein PLICRDRAFT_526523 [Plicaturopsis crispa FD-325 SS-3]|nr:hypothetical protein PLICRDRAFT_526523 [Plicaturopsis crispa FD-325 SS-3]
MACTCSKEYVVPLHYPSGRNSAAPIWRQEFEPLSMLDGDDPIASYIPDLRGRWMSLVTGLDNVFPWDHTIQTELELRRAGLHRAPAESSRSRQTIIRADSARIRWSVSIPLLSLSWIEHPGFRVLSMMCIHSSMLHWAQLQCSAPGPLGLSTSYSRRYLRILGSRRRGRSYISGWSLCF